MRYSKLKDIKENIPDEEFYNVIKKLIQKGYIKGLQSNEDIDETVVDLTYEMIRMFVIHDRAGLYDLSNNVLKP